MGDSGHIPAALTDYDPLHASRSPERYRVEPDAELADVLACWSVLDTNTSPPTWVASYHHRDEAELHAATLEQRHRDRMRRRRESAERLRAVEDWVGEYRFDRLGGRATLGPDSPAEDWREDDVVDAIGE